MKRLGILNDDQNAEIARQIEKGFYRGVFCADGWNFSWKLSVRVWNDEEDTTPSLESEMGGGVDPDIARLTAADLAGRIGDYS